MKMTTAKVTSKYQATIPLPIRKFLRISGGDEVSFLIQDDKVILNRIEPADYEFFKALEPTLDEWNSKEDDELFKNL